MLYILWSNFFCWFLYAWYSYKKALNWIQEVFSISSFIPHIFVGMTQFSNTIEISNQGPFICVCILHQTSIMSLSQSWFCFHGDVSTAIKLWVFLDFILTLATEDNCGLKSSVSWQLGFVMQNQEESWRQRNTGRKAVVQEIFKWGGLKILRTIEGGRNVEAVAMSKGNEWEMTNI